MSERNKIKELLRDSRIWGVHLLSSDIHINEDYFRQIKRQLPSKEPELNRLLCISETFKYKEADLLSSLSFVTALLLGITTILVNIFALELSYLTFFIIITILVLSLIINRKNNNLNFKFKLATILNQYL